MAGPGFTWGEGDTGIVADLDADSDVLLIAFGGIAGGLALPFEFVRSTADLSVKTIFVRDLMQSWYHRGAIDVGDDVDSVASHLSELVAASGAQRVVAVGNSAGGYAALLFACLTEIHDAHAFSPQTFITPDLRARHGDHRWEPQLSELARSGCLDSRYADLRAVLRGSAGTAYHVYYSAGEPLDVAHAEHLDGLDAVTLHPFEVGGHKLIKGLRDSGRLRSLLENVLRQPARS